MKTRVFVSSTYLDLRNTREFVCTALEKNMLEPVLFEKGGVTYDPDYPLDMSCYKRVSECELYVLIIGSRYGSKASQLEIQDVGTCEFNSVTRQEWVEAKKNNIPIYIFVKSDVLLEYHIYKKQDSETYMCVNVDDVNVFKLIGDIYSEKMNNALHPYDKPEQIVDIFLQQASGLLRKFLNARRSSRDSDLGKRDYLIDCYKLYYYRSMHKINQIQLASDVGCDARWLRKIENEKRPPDVIFHKASLNEISAIENRLGLPPGELVGSSSFFHEEKYKNYYYLSRKKKLTHDATMDRDKKVVVFDFDGTLTIQDKGHSTWEKLWIELGYGENECIKYHKKFSAGEINHSEWCKITQDKFNDKFISKKNLINVANSIKLIEGVSALMEKLHASGVAIYILSGSIEFIIKSVLSEAVKFVKDISSNDVIFDNEGLARIIGTEYDFEGKAEFIKKKIKHHGVPANEVLFVGNSNNDVHAFESNAVTLLINPVKVDPYSKSWTYYENNVSDLREIEKYIFPSAAFAKNK